MNKKIKELMKEANLTPYYDGQEKDIEKFAELIIKECQYVISEVYREMPLEICGWMIQLDDRILERFYNESKN